MKKSKTLNLISDKIESEILKGKYGKSGDIFITTRELSKDNNISLEYASTIMKILVAKRVIMLLGKHYYLTYKRVSINSPFYKKYSPQNKFGMIISDLNNAFVSGLAGETANQVNTTVYTLYIVMENDILRNIDSLLSEHVSGIFVDPFVARNNSEILKKCPVPIVSLGHDLTTNNIDSITVDNYRAGKIIANHFCEIGCETFCYVGFVRHTTTDYRLKGFKENVNKKGFNLTKEKTILIERDKQGKYDSKILNDAIKNLIWKTSSFKKIGIFCYHDLLAYDVITSLNKINLENQNLSISKNIAVAGFDNLSIASIIKPSLTTISYPTKEMAQKAVDSMLDAITNIKHKESKKEVEFSLIIRKTTK